LFWSDLPAHQHHAAKVMRSWYSFCDGLKLWNLNVAGGASIFVKKEIRVVCAPFVTFAAKFSSVICKKVSYHTILL